MTISANYVNEYTFTTHGTNNFTEEFHSGRRVRSYCGGDGYKYGTVSGSFYLESTTVVLYPDIDNGLTSNLESVEYGIVGTLNGSMPNHSHLNDESQGGLLFEASIVDLDKYTTGEIDNMLATLSGSIHDSVSLSVELSTNLLDISTQQLTLNNQEANTVFAGPSTGTENIPSFRKLVAEDIPVLGYLIPASDGVTSSSWTINSNRSNVTSTLTFGRTTGGDAIISYNGNGFHLSHPVGIGGIYPNFDVEIYSAGIARIGLGRNQNAREFVIEKDTDSPYGSSIYFTYTPTGGYGFLRLMASQDTEVARFVGADQSTLLAGNLTLNSTKADVTSTLTFGRTTGGDATISWDGSVLNIDKDIKIPGTRPVYISGASNYGITKQGSAVGGWVFGYSASKASDNAIIASWGFFGSADNIVYGYFGPTYTSNYLRIYPTYTHVYGNLLVENNSLTINSSKADVTSTLTFGRTTGGDATISWDGTSLTTNKSLTINSSTTVAMNRFITFNGLAGYVYATRTSAANTDAYIGFLDAKESWAYYFRTDSSHVWKVNNIDKMSLNNTTLTTTGNLYVGGNVSAESFTDRTPFFQGDALSEIMNIKGKDGEIDHSSLPSFARKEITKRRFEDVELTTEVDAKDAYIYDTRTVEVKGVKQEEIIEDSKKLKDTVYEDEKTGKFYEKDSVGEVKIKDGKPYQNVDVGEEVEQGRDLGAMISMLTVAVQQLTNRLSDIEKWAEKFGEASRQE